MSQIEKWVGARLRGSRITAPTFRRAVAARMARSPVSSEYHWMNALAAPGTSVIDVGANVGQCSALLARRVGVKGQVVALEPLQESFEELRAGTKSLGVWSLPYAAGEANKVVELHIPVDSIGSPRRQLASVVRSPEAGLRRQVRMIPLDCLEPLLYQRLSLVKIDVEGGELEVIRGATRLFENRRPNIVIEIEERHQPLGRSVEEVFEALTDLGYYLSAIGPNGLISLQEFDLDNHQRVPLSEPGHWYVNNFVAMSTASELRKAE